jgi:hypothetical protein
MGALNLPTGDGRTGDWHMIETFFRSSENKTRSFISGSGCETDTIWLLGQLGIFNCTEVIEKLKIPHAQGMVFAATHERAIADLVLDAVLCEKSPDYLRLDDWMPSDSDKQKVFSLLNIAMGKIEPSKRQRIEAWKEKNKD